MMSQSEFLKNKQQTVYKVLKGNIKFKELTVCLKQVTPPPEVYDRIKRDNKLIGKARSLDTSYDFLKIIYISAR